MSIYVVKSLNNEHLEDARTQKFVYTVKPLNKEHLVDARTQRSVYTVKPLNKEHLGDVMTLNIMTVYMEQNQLGVSYSEDSSNIHRFVCRGKPLNKEHLGDVMTLLSYIDSVVIWSRIIQFF